MFKDSFDSIEILKLICNNFKQRNVLDKIPIVFGNFLMRKLRYHSDREIYYSKIREVFLTIHNVLDKSIYINKVNKRSFDFFWNVLNNKTYKEYLKNIGI